MSTISYSPNLAVKAAHNIPHFSTSGQVVDYPFSFGSTTSGNKYVFSIFPLPLLVFALGILALLSYLVVLLFRCCCTCCKCGPDSSRVSNMNQESFSKWAGKVVRDRKAAIVFFSLFLSFTVIAIHALYFGNQNIDSGVSKGGDAISSLADIFSSISLTADDLSSSASSLSSSLGSMSCTSGSISDINSILDTIESSASSISSYVGTLPSSLDNGKTYLDDYGKTYKTYVLFCFYAVIMFVVIIYIIGAACKSRAMFYFGTIFSFVIVLGLTIICTIEMIMVMLMGDMCMDPSNNIAYMFGSGSSASSVVLYYSSCIGTNPLGFDVGNVTSTVSELNSTLYQLYTDSSSPCYHESSLQTAINSLGTMFINVDDLLSYTDCGPLAGVWNTAMNEGVCNFFMSGFFIVWLSMHISALCLFLMMVSGSSMSHYYGKYWKLSTEDDVNEFNTDIKDGPVEGNIVSANAVEVHGGDIELAPYEGIGGIGEEEYAYDASASLDITTAK